MSSIGLSHMTSYIWAAGIVTFGSTVENIVLKSSMWHRVMLSNILTNNENTYLNWYSKDLQFIGNNQNIILNGQIYMYQAISILFL